MPITNQDTLAAALANSQRRPIYKASGTSIAGRWFSLWKQNGTPGPGSNPPAYTAGSGYVPTNATAGAIPLTNPASGILSYLTRFYANTTTQGSIILYDRLWACSGMSANVQTLQSVTTPGSLTRPDSTGADVEAWFEVYTTTGATGTGVWTLTYVDQDGNGSQSATWTRTAVADSAGMMMPFQLAAGDTGVRQVTGLTLSVSTGTAGDVGVTLLRRLAEIPVPIVNVGQAQDALATGLARIYDSSCLALMVGPCTTTNTGNVHGSLMIGQV